MSLFVRFKNLIFTLTHNLSLQTLKNKQSNDIKI